MSERMSTTESSLTELDEDDVEMESLPAVSAQRAYDYILPLMDAFNAAIAPIPLSAERKDDWRESTQALRLKALQKPHKAAIVGRTGPCPCSSVGKSTLLNALLQHPVLSASASGACTAVPIEVSYKATEGTDATIEFISAEHWETHLGRLLEDAMDKTVDVEEGPADDSGPSLAYQAREKIIGIYPHLRDVDAEKWKLEALLTDGIVTQYLNKTVSLSTSDSDSMSFEKKLEQYLASDPLTGSGCRKLWPLVKIVKIVGKFEVLSTGITLVDLPGHGDADNARDSVANEYLKSADSVFLVAGITRAKDDRDIHAYLHRHLRQIIVDGRIQNKTISLILTGADSSIGSNECTLEGAEQETVDTLKEETLRLTDEIKDLVARKEKKEKSKAKKKNTVILQYQEQIALKKTQKDAKNKLRNRLLAHGRCRIVEKALQEKYAHLYRSLSGLSADAPVPSIPIFSLGSRDYLCIKDIELNDPTTFFDPEETGIPGLKRYLENDGERRSLTDAISVVTGFYEFLSRASQIPMKTAGNGTESLWIHNALADLEKGCETKLDELVTQMETAYGELQAHVVRAVGQAERDSPEVFAGHAKRLKWNQYRAMMRLEGQYEGGNLNTDLIKCILPALSKEWNLCVNVKIPLFLSDFYDDIQADLTTATKAICAGSSLPNSDSLRKSLGLETFIQDLRQANETATSSAQRQGSRTWEPIIKLELSPQYARVSLEKGGGMFKRMKLNEDFIRTSAPALFSTMSLTVSKLFKHSTESVQKHTRTQLTRLLKQMSDIFIGSEKSSALEALNAQGEVERIVKGFEAEHEDPIVEMLDSLKTRLQEIQAQSSQ